MRSTAALILALSVVSAVPTGAAELRVELPPESTTIGFTLKATMHTVHGTAALDRGEFVFDTDDQTVSGEAVVAAASADTDNKKRDKKMHTKVLVSGEHPLIVLRAETFEGTLTSEGASEITVVGVMELLGREHPIRIPMTVSITDGNATVDAEFPVPYVEWGLSDPSTFVLRVGKEVPVTVRVEDVTVSVIAEP